MLYLTPQRSHAPQLRFLVMGVLLKQPQMLLLQHFLLLVHLQAPKLLLLQQTGGQNFDQDAGAYRPALSTRKRTLGAPWRPEGAPGC